MHYQSLGTLTLAERGFLSHNHGQSDNFSFIQNITVSWFFPLGITFNMQHKFKFTGACEFYNAWSGKYNATSIIGMVREPKYREFVETANTCPAMLIATPATGVKKRKT